MPAVADMAEGWIWASGVEIGCFSRGYGGY